MGKRGKRLTSSYEPVSMTRDRDIPTLRFSLAVIVTGVGILP